MAKLTPTITGLSPQNTIIINLNGGAMNGISDPYEILFNVQAAAGTVFPVMGTALLTIINANLYRFEDNGMEKSRAFTLNQSPVSLRIPFRIRNIHQLSANPFPLILSVCTFDQADGEMFKVCRNGQFPVQKSAASMRIRSFR